MRRITLLGLTFSLLACSAGSPGGGLPGDDVAPADATIDRDDAPADRADDLAAPDAPARDVQAPDAVAPDAVAPDAVAPDAAADAPTRDAVVDVPSPDVPADASVADARADAPTDAPRDVFVPSDAPRAFPAGIGMGVSTALPPERRVTCGTPSMAAPAVTPGAADRIVLRGRVVTPTGVLAAGEVLMQAGLLSCVAASCASRAGYAGATVIETRGIIYPGLVNTHDHPQYDFLPPWTPPTLYGNSDQWQGATAYRAVTEPLRTNEAMHTCAMLKWGELRAIVSGTTSVQGALNRVCATRTLARNVEYGTDFGGVDTHRTNTLGIASVTAAAAVTLRAAIDGGSVSAYILHLSEGVNEAAWREWGMLTSRDLLVPQLTVIHGTALGREEFGAMASVGARLIWSPRSNLVLYGRTTDVGAALDAGVLVALAPDWTPTGSPNLLVEMRYAREVSRAALGNRLTSRDLFEMATARAAQAIARPQVGALVEGRYADVMVIPDRGCDAYDSILDAPVADVRLVVIGGRPMYGDAALIDALPAAARARCEPLRACGQEKRACVALADTTNELDRTAAQIEAELGAFSTPYALVPQCPP
jgi:5-methylthioadenosine/S-adenosylhomocysteine deaminase